jgi:hypothetical protein
MTGAGSHSRYHGYLESARNPGDLVALHQIGESPRMQIKYVTILLRAHGGYNDREVRSYISTKKLGLIEKVTCYLPETC